MKKFLLALSAFAALASTANAQTRMTLHEEFTGENCGPCASTNPSFWELCDSSINVPKLIHISYMAPIPSAGPFYYQDQATSDTRVSYYSVPFAPYGRYDGAVPDATQANPGHPGYFSQADINAEAAIASPFNMTITNAYNATFDSVITTINVTCVSAYSGTNIYLRTALIETVDFATPPGSNGETHFENVVRAMYPSALGTAMTGTWTAGMTHTYTVTGAIPSYVDISKHPYMVGWIQRDDDKNVAQAAKGAILQPIANDAALTAVTGPGLKCSADGSYTTAHTVTLHNAGSNALTSATIYYSIDGGAMASYNWTGNLDTNASVSVTMPTATTTVSGAAYHIIYDSVSMPNGVSDHDINNNANGADFFIESTNGLPMPYTTSFEDGGTENYSDNITGTDGEAWGVYTNGSGTSLAHTGTYAAMFNNFGFASGDQAIYTLPEVTTTAPSAIDFWVAYAQYSTENDKLEVVYSIDCGATWTSLWSKAGSSLATAAATTSEFVPTASEYVEHSVSLNAVPAGSMIGFRATSNYGNLLWLDDINVRSGEALGVSHITSATLGAAIYPNPAKDEATLSFNLINSSDVQVQIIDGLGRVVNTVANSNMNSGAHTFTINTSALANGIYSVNIHTANGTFTERLSVVK